MKPILFNTEMVRAILDGRKTVTRRICNITINGSQNVPGNFCTAVEFPAKNFLGVCANFFNDDGFYRGAALQKYFKGDILYVRETWAKVDVEMFEEYIYKADWKDGAESPKWRPSIYMPKKAARIFLRVKDVRVERLKDIKDGWRFAEEGIVYEHGFRSEAWRDFQILWDSTVKPADRDKYGWDANPWVWVIEFEQISKSFEQISKSKALEEENEE